MAMHYLTLECLNLGPFNADNLPDRRKNGFEKPLRKRQVFAVIVVVTDILFFFVTVFPLLEGSEKWCFMAAFISMWCIMAASWIVLEKRDPKDPAVGEEDIVADTSLPKCGVCNVHVRVDSKHCWECNKCVSNFDHHCPWLNTCVGRQNYIYFFCVIWSLLMMLVLLMASAVLLVLRHWADDEDAANPLEILGLAEGATAVLLFIIAAIHLPLWGLDIFLVGFHCMLCCRGITTYEFLTGKRPRPAKQIQEAADADVVIGATLQDAASMKDNEEPVKSPGRAEDSSPVSAASKKRSEFSLGTNRSNRSHSTMGENVLKRDLSGFLFGNINSSDPAEEQEKQRLPEKEGGTVPPETRQTARSGNTV